MNNSQSETEHQELHGVQLEADRELEIFLQLQKQLPQGQPLEVIPYLPYTDTPEFKAKLDQQLEELCKIANSAKKQASLAEGQAKLAEEQAKQAQKEAIASKRQSRISNVIASIAVLIALFTWLIPQEAIIELISSFFG